MVYDSRLLLNCKCVLQPLLKAGQEVPAKTAILSLLLGGDFPMRLGAANLWYSLHTGSVCQGVAHALLSYLPM